MAAQERGLPVQEFRRLVCGEATKIENRMRAWAVEISRIRNENLIEAVVLQAPESRAPFEG